MTSGWLSQMHPQPILKADLFAPTTLQSTAYMFHRKTPQKKWKCLKNQAVEDWGLSKMFSFCGFWNEVSRFFLRIHVDAQDNYTIYRHRILRCALGSFWYLTPIYISCVFFSAAGSYLLKVALTMSLRTKKVPGEVKHFSSPSGCDCEFNPKMISTGN